MKITRPLLCVLGASVLVLGACGGDDGGGHDSMTGDDTMSDEPASDNMAQSERTVEVEMTDNAFEPTSLEVQEGETVKFVFDNTGEVAHDAYIGDAEAQADHEDEMREAEMGEDDGMGHGGDGEAITVEPGDTGELVHTFDEAGTIEIGCHEAGHYAAGMKIDVTVS